MTYRKTATRSAGLFLMLALLALPPAAHAQDSDSTAAGNSITVSDSVMADGPYEANWESIRGQYEIPAWFRDAKLGIFIHWGPYSVPAFGSEWYPRRMYEQDTVRHASGRPTGTDTPVYDHHVATYGDPSEFGYKDFIPMFKAERFDADAWLDLFEEAGARYVIPVAEHHDGFAMYNSTKTRWNAVDMGPKRDVIGELAEATRARGLKFGASSHYAFNWDYFTRKEGWDTADPQYADLYAPPHEQYEDPVSEDFMAHWWARTTEIIDEYQPDVLWFDFYIDRPEFAPYHPRLAAYYYNKGQEWGKPVVLQNKNMYYESFPPGTHVLDIERGKLAGTRYFHWQTDTSVGKNSWGYVTNWASKDPNTLVDDLVDIVSKNGNMLLNVGPKADGTIPDDQAGVLRALGGWLDANGEAIYGTRPWITFGEGPTETTEGHHSEGGNEQFTAQDIRFTTKGDTLFAILMAWPETGTVQIQSLAEDSPLLDRTVSDVALLNGGGEPLQWSRDGEGLTVQLPPQKPGDYAYVLAITLD